MLKNNKVINLKENTPHKVEKLFCINCCKSLVYISEQRDDISKVECPVCKNKMRKYEDLCLYDIFDIFSRRSEEIHEKKYNYFYKKEFNEKDKLRSHNEIMREINADKS